MQKNVCIYSCFFSGGNKLLVSSGKSLQTFGIFHANCLHSCDQSNRKDLVDAAPQPISPSNGKQPELLTHQPFREYTLLLSFPMGTLTSL